MELFSARGPQLSHRTQKLIGLIVSPFSQGWTAARTVLDVQERSKVIADSGCLRAVELILSRNQVEKGW